MSAEPLAPTDSAVALHRTQVAERRLRAQFALSEILSSATTLADAGAAILRAVGASLDTEVGELWIVDDARERLDCVATVASERREAADFVAAARELHFASGKGLPGRVWAAGVPSWEKDVGAENFFARQELARAAGLASAVAFPVRFAGRTTGVIQFFHHARYEPDNDVLDIFRDVGGQVGLFLERTRMDHVLVAQAREILALSTPVLRLADGVIVVPLIGAIDGARAHRMTESVLSGVVDTGARVLLLDLTGVPSMDTETARHVGDMARAVQLLGAKVLLTGVAAGIAKTLVMLGIDMSGIECSGSLADGLGAALERLRPTRPRA